MKKWMSILMAIVLLMTAAMALADRYTMVSPRVVSRP